MKSLPAYNSVQTLPIEAPPSTPTSEVTEPSSSPVGQVSESTQSEETNLSCVQLSGERAGLLESEEANALPLACANGREKSLAIIYRVLNGLLCLYEMLADGNRLQTKAVCKAKPQWL